MPKGISNKLTFKPYDQNQIELIPPTAEELIPEFHLVRIVSSTLDQLNLEPLLNQYERGGGASRYSPLMLVKVLVYGYLNNVCSSRLLAKQVRENIYFRWIAGCQQPDFRTINSFRKNKLAPIIDEVFVEVVKLLHEKGYVQLKSMYVDGTKIESRANRYTFVWKRAVDTFDTKLEEKVRVFIAEAKQLTEAEDIEFGDEELPEMGKGPISSETISAMADKLNARIAKLTESKGSDAQASKKKLQKIHRSFKKDFLPRKQNYEHHRMMFDGRNSYSKTDPDATFMRMKEDHMRNGQLKPGYNVQVGTENGFVVSYAIYPNPTDSRTLLSHVDAFEKAYGRNPENLVADKGYGSYENYRELEKRNIGALIKYPHWEQEKKKRSKKYRYRTWRFFYDEVRDEVTCPEGQRLSFLKEKQRWNWSRTELQKSRLYKCDSCNKCPQQKACTNREFRTVEINPDRIRLYRKARDRLNSEKGWQLYRKRGSEVETVFGQIKGNQGFRRFRSWGKQAASCDWGIHMIAYNLKNLGREGVS
jgi:transposase